MREHVLADYLEGRADAAALSKEFFWFFHGRGWASAAVRDLAVPLLVRPAHLARVCEDVMDGRLEPSMMEAVACALLGSPSFVLGPSVDGRLASVLLREWAHRDLGRAFDVADARGSLERMEPVVAPERLATAA
ncbi:MAG TPA: hypothetical protein VJV23_15240 [Candidatus Polarisedimenticolia bacterium]|nr:hypothetical protein [Candidatus Polarisedimenticolia bacterium]